VSTLGSRYCTSICMLELDSICAIHSYQVRIDVSIVWRIIEVDHIEVPKAKGPMRPKHRKVGLYLGPRPKKLLELSNPIGREPNFGLSKGFTVGSRFEVCKYRSGTSVATLLLPNLSSPLSRKYSSSFEKPIFNLGSNLSPKLRSIVGCLRSQGLLEPKPQCKLALIGQELLNGP
jgi:hypothetical protein